MLLRITLIPMALIALGLSMTSCIKPHSNSPYVYGGEEAKDSYPHSLKMIVTTDKVDRTCGGTFITDALFLTAAHCLEGAEVVSIDGVVKDKKIESKKWKKHPDFKTGKDSKDAMYIPPEFAFADVAVVVFPNKTAGDNLILKTAKDAPANGDLVYVVGFGANKLDGSGVGTKRVGINTIDSLASEGDQLTIRVRGADIDEDKTKNDEASLGSGDYGSPLYNSNKELIGVASFKLRSNGISYFSNVFGKSVREFIEKVKKEGGEPAKNTDSELFNKVSDSSVNVDVSCKNRILDVAFKDGSDKKMTVTSCSNVEVSCDKKLLKITVSAEGISTSSAADVSSEELCGKLKDAIKKKIADLPK